MINKSSILTSLLSLAFLFTGCEKDSQDVATGGSDPVQLNVVFGGIEEFKTPATTRSGEAIQTFVQPFDSLKDTGIDVVTIVEMVPAENVQTRATLVDNAVFRIYIYDNDGTMVDDPIYNVKGTTAIPVKDVIVSPGTYKFVCITANGTKPIAGVGVAKVSNGLDFATYCTSKSISSSNNTIGIVFKRQASQLQLAVNASGFTNNNATYSSAKVDNLGEWGVWDINKDSSDETEMVVSGVSNITCVNNTQYPILPISRNLLISLNNLTIDGTDYGTKEMSVPANFVRGGNYKITVQFTRAIKPIVVAGIKWAPGNLIEKNGVYKFADSQKEIGGLWPADSKEDDLCKSVIPENTWRLPTTAEYRKLIDAGLDNVTTPQKGFALDELFFPANYDGYIIQYMAYEWFNAEYRYCLTNGILGGEKPGFDGLLRTEVGIRCVKNQ